MKRIHEMFRRLPGGARGPLLVLAPVWIAACADTGTTTPEAAETTAPTGVPRTSSLRAASNMEAIFDSMMLAFTGERGIGAAALGVWKDGEIVYDRAFGWMDRERKVPVRQDLIIRVASVSKAVTATAIRHLAADGKLALDDYVFDLGQREGGLLEVNPVPALGDPRAAQITVRHLLLHESGCCKGGWWDYGAVARATGVPSPPGREEMVRYLLGLPLHTTPGTRYQYSNEGYLLLGHVVETVSARDYMDYVHEEIFAPLGIGRDDFILGRTFPEHRSEREPWYDASRLPLVTNVFDPLGPLVPRPDGGWDQSIGMAYGGLVASTEALLKFIAVYQLGYGVTGLPRQPGRSGWGQGGGAGSSALVRQTHQGINFAAIFNRNARTGHGYPLEMTGIMDELLESGRIVWP